MKDSRRKGNIPIDGGLLYPRGKKGTWWLDYKVNLKSCRKSLRTTSSFEARKLASEFLAKLQTQPTDRVPENVAVTDAKERYLASCKVDQRSAKTITKYRGVMSQFIEFAAKHSATKLNQISPTLFDLYRSTYAKSLKPYTLHVHGIIIKGWLEFCVSRRLMRVNPLKGIQFKAGPRPRHPATTAEEFTAIVGASAGPLRSILCVLGLTGLRVGECLNLRIEDIDLDRNLIHVAGTKTDCAQRDIPIHPVLLPELKAAIGRRTVGLLFPNANAPTTAAKRGSEQPCNDRTVLKQFTQIATRFGFKTGTAQQGLTIHSLRRFFKSTVIISGVPMPMVDRWCGHRSKGMDFHYVRFTLEQEHEQMAKVRFRLNSALNKEVA